MMDVSYSETLKNFTISSKGFAAFNQTFICVVTKRLGHQATAKDLSVFESNYHIWLKLCNFLL